MIDYLCIDVMIHTQTIHSCGRVLSETNKSLISLYPAPASNKENGPLTVIHEDLFGADSEPYGFDGSVSNIYHLLEQIAIVCHIYILILMRCADSGIHSTVKQSISSVFYYILIFGGFDRLE